MAGSAPTFSGPTTPLTNADRGPARDLFHVIPQPESSRVSGVVARPILNGRRPVLLTRAMGQSRKGGEAPFHFAIRTTNLGPTSWRTHCAEGPPFRPLKVMVAMNWRWARRKNATSGMVATTFPAMSICHWVRRVPWKFNPVCDRGSLWSPW